MTDYAGPERRQERLNLAEAMTDVRNLQAAVVGLTEAAAHMVPREEIEERLLSQEEKRRQIVITAIALAIILGALILTNRAVIAEIGKNTAEAREGTLCLIEQLAEHRESSRRFFEENSQVHGFEFRKDIPPPPVPSELKKACEAFFPPYPPGPPEVPQ